MIKLGNTSWVIFIFLLAMSCTKEEETVIDPVFTSFLAEFQTQSQFRSVDVEEELSNLTIGLTTDKSDAIGQCITYTNGQKEIRINRNEWEQAEDLIKELLLFHELGHCVLNRDHLNEVDDYGRCVSIMRESSSTCRIKYDLSSRKEYLDELFK